MFIPRKEVIKSGTVWDLDVINQITYQGVPFIPGGASSDERVKITVADTTAGYLGAKVAAGTGIQVTITNPGANETLTFAIGNHDASLITTGTIGTARLATGTANSTTYLRGDQTWQTITGGVAGFTGSQNTASPNNTVNASRLLVDAVSTNADAVIQPKGSGALLAQLPDSTVTGGNKRGANAVDLQTVRTQASQIAGGAGSVVVGGQRNSAWSAQAVTVGGLNNYNGGAWAGIVAGQNNSIGTSYQFIGSGLGNTLSYQAEYSTVITGNSNSIGSSNISQYCFIGSGLSNSINGYYCSVATGQSNTVNGQYSTVISGASNNINGNYITCVAGQFNYAASYGTYGMVAGYNNYVYHDGAIALGQLAQTTTTHQRVWASGSANGQSGCSQQADNHLYVQTTNGSAVNMTIGGATLSGTTSIAVPLNSAFFFKIYVVCKRTPTSTADFGAWEITGLATNLGGTVTLYNVTTNLLHRSNGGYSAAVVADSTNDTVNIQVTGVAGHTINWSAYAQTIVSATP